MAQNKKLYPPIIDGILPAFYGTELSVPFSMNKAVGKNEYDGFSLKIKNIRGNEYSQYYNSNTIIDNKIIFNIENSSQFTIGQYYKIQIAYTSNGIIGYYSDIGIIKYTAKPLVYIEGLDKNQINTHNYIYIGKYEQTDDVTEKVYNYKFNIYCDNKLFETSNWLLHNSNLDENSYESYDIFEFNKDLELNKNYQIQYEIKTNNGLIITSDKYYIKQKSLIDSEYNIKIIPRLNYNNGYVQLNFESNESQEPQIGSFVVFKSSSLSEFKEWNNIYSLTLNRDYIDNFSFKDFDVAYGVEYKYSIAQVNKYNLITEKQVSDAVQVYFEDMFLFDGERQLKIRFNPKISSFKEYIPEIKIDTIGSKYPYFFRNGQVCYKEFPISGLISHQADEENLFLNIENKSINLSDDNLEKEKYFKLKVLEWLNNGKSKLFKSPSEGNYIVYLLNTNLTPIDSLSRMLHSFSCNAYEIGDYNYEDMKEQGLIKINEYNPNLYTLETLTDLNTLNIEILPHEVDYICFEGIEAGAQVDIDGSIITFGTNEKYEYNGIVKSIKLISGNWENAILTIRYLKQYKSDFDKVVSIESSNQNQELIGPTNLLKYNGNVIISFLNSATFQANTEKVSDIYEDYNININGVEINLKDVKSQTYTVDNIKFYDLSIGQSIIANINYVQNVLKLEEEGE